MGLFNKVVRNLVRKIDSLTSTSNIINERNNIPYAVMQIIDMSLDTALTG